MKTARTIQQHEQFLANQKASLENSAKYMVAIVERYERDKRDYEFYALQISKAKIEGKVAFDQERYMKKRASK